MNMKNYIGKNIIAWIWSRENPRGGDNKRCYVHPKFIIKGGTYEPIDSADFPQLGGIEVGIQGGETTEDLFERIGAQLEGSIVNVFFNTEPQLNTNTYATNSYYHKYCYKFGKSSSDIWIEPFKANDLYQIIDVDCDMSVLDEEKVISTPNVKLYTNVLLLRCGEELYGPFEYDLKGDSMNLYGCKEYQYLVGIYDSIKYNDNLLVIEDQDNVEISLLLPKAVVPSPNKCERSFDWISEDKLMDCFWEVLRVRNNYTRDQIRQIKDSSLQFLKTNSEVAFSDERIARISHLIEGMSAQESSVQGIIQSVMDDVRFREVLIRELADDHFDLIKAKIPEYSSVQNKIDELNAEKAQIEEQIKELEKSTKSTEVIPTDLLEKVEKLEFENNELRRNVADLQTTLNQIGDAKKRLEQLNGAYEKIKNQYAEEKRKYDQKVIDNNDLEKQFEKTLNNFRDEAQTTAKILDNKLLDRILRSIDSDSGESISSTEFDTTLLNTVPMDSTEIINQVSTFVREKAHREATFNDIANYLICISQGFITTFAGEPGTGKTSLCNILAKALGLLSNDSQKRFVDISVERGWSSHKDFIGYYNPLTKSIEKSNAEVFNAFAQMDSEYGCEQSDIAPFIVLLDEANLSPIEHYWAAFLRNCDFTSVSNRSISLGGNKSFRLPEHLRFLATVNFDHTTEELSPRFLDRSWVIMLEPTRIDDAAEEDIENFEGMMSFAKIKDAFGAKDSDIIDEAIQTKWSAIQKIFKDQSLQIMPRNLKMVKNYCAVACRCMEHDTPATKFAPLDYAFSQKILPTINGSGDNYRLLIDNLLIECTSQNMPISTRHLERMKRIAENNMGFFQFFSR